MDLQSSVYSVICFELLHFLQLSSYFNITWLVDSINIIEIDPVDCMYTLEEGFNLFVSLRCYSLCCFSNRPVFPMNTAIQSLPHILQTTPGWFEDSGYLKICNKIFIVLFNRLWHNWVLYCFKMLETRSE